MEWCYQIKGNQGIMWNRYFSIERGKESGYLKNYIRKVQTKKEGKRRCGKTKSDYRDS